MKRIGFLQRDWMDRINANNNEGKIKKVILNTNLILGETIAERVKVK